MPSPHSLAPPNPMPAPAAAAPSRVPEPVGAPVHGTTPVADTASAASLPAGDCAEADRLLQLRRLLVLDSAPDAVFDSIARMASDACGVPIALLSLVDGERQWFKANVGLPGVHETPRSLAFCAHTIAGSDLFEVPDASCDPRFADNPLVTDGPRIRFYAGVPLVLQAAGSADARVGTLCVIDHQARQLTPAQQRTLQQLAVVATQALVMRRDLILRTLQASSEHDRQQRRHQAFLQRIGHVAGVGGWQLELDGNRLTWSEETHAIHGLPLDHVPTLESAVSFYAPEARPLIAQAVERGIATGRSWDLELPLITAAGCRRWVRTMGEVEFENGQPVRLFGAIQDITAHRSAQQQLRELTAITEHSTDYVLQTDAGGRVTYINPAARRALGLDEDADLSGRHFSEFNTPATNALFARTILPTLAERGVWLGDATVRLAAGREAPVSYLLIAHRDGNGQGERYSAVLRDISAEQQAQRQLQQQSGILQSVAEAIPALVTVVGADGRLRFVNGAFARRFNAERASLLGRTLASVVGEEMDLLNAPHVHRVLAGEAVQFEQENPGRDSWRHTAITYTPLRGDNGAVDGFVSVAHDISQHRREQGRLRQLSEHDPLTGLLNRAGFESHLDGCVNSGGGASLALLYIDLDRFKPVNDQHGHATGDQLLQAFARRLQAMVRPSDAVARLGGDEFVIALTQVRAGANACRVADKVLAAAHTPFDIGGLRLGIGACVGVAFGADRDGGWRALLARADAMLYAAKAGGRGRQAGEQVAGADDADADGDDGAHQAVELLASGRETEVGTAH